MSHYLMRKIKSLGLIQTVLESSGRPYNFHTPLLEDELAYSDLFYYPDPSQYRVRLIMPMMVFELAGCDALRLHFFMWDSMGSLVQSSTQVVVKKGPIIFDVTSRVEDLGWSLSGTFACFVTRVESASNSPLQTKGYVVYQSAKNPHEESVVHADQLSLALTLPGSVRPKALKLWKKTVFQTGCVVTDTASITFILRNHSDQRLAFEVGSKTVVINPLGSAALSLERGILADIRSRLALVRPLIMHTDADGQTDWLHG